MEDNIKELVKQVIKESLSIKVGTTIWPNQITIVLLLDGEIISDCEDSLP